MPEFAFAATTLKEMGSPILFAKLDGDRHTKAASRYGIKGYPTLLLFVNGTSQVYTGGFTGDEIVIWVRKKTGLPTLRLSSFSEAEEFLKKNWTSAVGFFKEFEFVEENKYPLVTRLTEHNSAKVYSRPIKLQIMFLLVDSTDDNLAKPLLTLFGLEPIKPIDFCSQLLTGNLLPYYKSEPIPVENKGDVQTVVGKTFDDIVINSSADVLLEAYTPWCMNCKAMSKLIDKVAKHFKGVPSLVIARIDASANEHPNLQVHDSPTVLFYSADNKGTPIALAIGAGDDRRGKELKSARVEKIINKPSLAKVKNGERLLQNKVQSKW